MRKINIAAKIGIISLLVIGAISSSIEKRNERDFTVSYWLWAGITAQAAPPDAEYYIYQGLISHKGDATAYRRIGLYPYPIKARKLFLVYRLEGVLPDPEMVTRIFQDNVAQWQRHPLTITGLQLDFDSPTSKLLNYSDFLKKLRQTLPQKYALSITGLGDWAIYGDKQAITAISQSTDELVFQLYQGWQPLSNMDAYINALSHYPLPFRIGLLAGNNDDGYIDLLKKNPNFKGIMYFIQKKL